MRLIGFIFIIVAWWGNCHAEPHTIVVTCATGELGAATARLLASDHPLILTGRNLLKLQELQKELTSSYAWKYEICPLDYSSSSSIAHFGEFLQKRNGSISGLVLMTPRPRFYGKDVLQEEAAWLDVFRETFTGPLEALRGALTHMRRGSKIVIIAGTTSVQYLPEAGPTCVIRRMWTTYAKALTHQLGPQGINVNALSPGIVLTQFHQDRIQKKAQENGLSYEEQMEKEVEDIPIGRHAQPQEVAQAIRFLLSEESNFFNGTNFVLDGGVTVSYP